MFRSFMPIALDEARAAANRGEVPVGACITRGPEVISQAGNRCRELNDPTAHAEILAVRAACAWLNTERLTGCALWVTLEPCAMCAGAIATARLDRLYFGASDPKSGGVQHGARVLSHPQAHHHPDIFDGVDSEACATLLRQFFEARRGA